MQKKILLSTILLCCFQNIFSQANNTESLYKWYDAEIGNINLSLNNGRLFNDIYPTNKNTNRYFEEPKFQIGEVAFDHQYYPAVCINYDLLEDALLLKPNCENDRNALIVIKNRNQYFILNDKKFVNLNYNTDQKNEEISGYYEEFINNKLIKFYIKYKKNKREVYVENRILNEYDLKNEFWLDYKDKFYKINSKNSITKLIPELKTQINNFFQVNSQLENDNKLLFMKNLFKYIDGLQ
jgi:hypothetical protein